MRALVDILTENCVESCLRQHRRLNIETFGRRLTIASVKANDMKPIAIDTTLTVARAMILGHQPMRSSTWGVWRRGRGVEKVNKKLRPRCG